MSDSISADRLRPPQGKGQSTVARVADDWYVACESRELRAKPLARVVLGIPLVLFRDGEGAAGALLDRCPHRGVPLSLGRVADGQLECGYHGWRFDRGGTVRRVPALCAPHEAKGRCTRSFPVREVDGFVWVWPDADTEPTREPYRFPHLDDDRYSTVVDQVDAHGSMHAVAENALDVPHTAFLHSGLFRGDGARNRIEVVVRRWHDRVEAEYIGEPRPPGVVGRLLAPGGGVVRHFDRFLMPCIAQVDYQLGDRSHVCVSTALTPVRDYYTKLYAVASFRLPIPHWLVKLVLHPLGRRIFAQDARMLVQQTRAAARFGGEHYLSTEVDTLGPHILRLLRGAERGDRVPMDAPVEHRLEMDV